MCDVSRREFLAGGTVLLTLAAEAELLGGPVPAGVAEAATADLIAPDVYFHEGNVADNADAVCNNGWIMFEDYVLVIDANFPAAARVIGYGRANAKSADPAGIATYCLPSTSNVIAVE
jgi:hypothetical protein